jgi:sirohydrochlorin cobaltochelatase
MGQNHGKTLEALELRLKTILPETYQDSYEDVQPVSMGSAGLKYGIDGKVAWNEIWGSFCDLAMAGGPPHKGALLEPASEAEINAQPDRYGHVVDEICRGISMVTLLPVHVAPRPGWVRVDCLTGGMAGWLLRAIVMENVSVQSEGATLDLPAGPEYRLEKEIKNVVTVIAKTAHYWLEHMNFPQQRLISDLFVAMAAETPLVEPYFASGSTEADRHRLASVRMAETIHRNTGLRSSHHEYIGWLGVECPSVRAAVWMMRAMVATNVLSRREGTVLFVPVNPANDPDGEIVVAAFARIHGFAITRGVL